jgi:protein XRP2
MKEKTQSTIGQKPKKDKRNFMFVGLSDQELVKKPGEINGEGFKLDSLTNCTIYLLDHISQV